ncbi:hypothetical protein RD792_003946 [Penstemon davidsonii]|uniref:Phytocyanin domain-containing protein n=1 Tax=Penstemon davidsonii TaxID=160366 RepID=A0ABR0DH85_9LAMI|nr:hypothetical protein RD792_003946 [Penstemon davidsonii]
MAPNALLMIVIVMMVAVLATPSCATDYVVGDYSGWTLGVDYVSWANGKQFYVGDKLSKLILLSYFLSWDALSIRFQSLKAVPMAWEVGGVAGFGKGWMWGKAELSFFFFFSRLRLERWRPRTGRHFAATVLVRLGANREEGGGVFKYVEGKHNVYKVNGTAFQQCSVPSESGGLTSGNDVITLATPGSKWYICGVGEHCNYGMKLVINVSCAVAPASAPAPMVVVQDKNKSMGFWRFWNLF